MLTIYTAVHTSALKKKPEDGRQDSQHKKTEFLCSHN